MATQTAISTISYNTEPFLIEVLEDLRNNHIIQCYQYIKHIGEDGGKDHIHLRIEPNRRIDPMDLSEKFLEYPIKSDNPNKPLTCRPWRQSKEEDWYLYVVHDPIYLKSKYGDFYSSLDGKIEYDFHDIQVSQYYDLDEAFIRAKAHQKHTTSNLAKRLQDGEDGFKLIQEGANPISINNIKKALGDSQYDLLLKEFQSLQADFNEREIFIEKLLNAITDYGAHIEIYDNGDIEVRPGRKDF